MMEKSPVSFVKSLYNQPYLLLTVTSFCWGANAVAGRLSVDEISPIVIVFFALAVCITDLFNLLSSPNY